MLDWYNDAVKSAGRGPTVILNLPDRLSVRHLPRSELTPAGLRFAYHADGMIRARFMVSFAREAARS